MSTTSTSSIPTAAPELLEGSEAGRRCVLDYLHKRQARKADDASPDAGDASAAAVVGSMTPAVLRAAALAHDGYETPALNDRLYLHYRVRWVRWLGWALGVLFDLAGVGEWVSDCVCVSSRSGLRLRSISTLSSSPS